MLESHKSNSITNMIVLMMMMTMMMMKNDIDARLVGFDLEGESTSTMIIV